MMNSKQLRLLFEYGVELILVCILAYIVCPPKVLVGEPNFHGNEFLWGIMQGIMAFFGWVISWLGINKTGCPEYIQSGAYWNGYFIGVLTFISGCYLQINKLYKYKAKKDGKLN